MRIIRNNKVIFSKELFYINALRHYNA